MTSRILTILGLALLGLGAYLAWHFWPKPEGQGDQPNVAREALDDLERRNYRPLSGDLDSLLRDPGYISIPTQADPLLNRQAPDFSLSDVAGNTWKLSEEIKHGPVVLVFYYGYHCNHCVSQLFALDRDRARFEELGAQIVAISADPVEVTRERYQKYGAFGFPVLTDPGYKVAERYGSFAPSTVPGEDGNQLHGTFIIDRHGKVTWANRGDQPFTENRTLLREIHRGER
jgi:peroxiredoxin